VQSSSSGAMCKSEDALKPEVMLEAAHDMLDAEIDSIAEDCKSQGLNGVTFLRKIQENINKIVTIVSRNLTADDNSSSSEAGVQSICESPHSSGRGEETDRMDEDPEDQPDLELTGLQTLNVPSWPCLAALEVCQVWSRINTAKPAERGSFPQAPPSTEEAAAGIAVNSSSFSSSSSSSSWM